MAIIVEVVLYAQIFASDYYGTDIYAYFKDLIKFDTCSSDAYTEAVK